MEERKSNNGTVELRCHLSDIRIEQREGNTDGRTVTGYAAKFESWSEPICGWFVEQICRGAFDECDTSDAIMCFNHNVDDILTRTSSGTLTLAVDEVRLRFAFEAPATTRSNDMVELLRRGDVNKCSFRFIVGQDEWLYADEQNGLKYDQRTIVKVSKLYDVALYRDTEASVRHLEERKADYLRSLRDKTPAEKTSAESSSPQLRNNDTTARCLSRDRLVRVLRLKRRRLTEHTSRSHPPPESEIW